MYLARVGQGVESPVMELASQLGVSQKTASNYLFKARERALLTTAGQGRAGGALTDKAKEILDGQH
jgi:DNA-binding transcriptional ArsR family regulator